MKDIRKEYADSFDERMCKEYPVIFQARFKDMSETCMCWGISVGEGWYGIIEECVKKIQFMADKFNVVIIADQIKEKFGTLRFYYHVQGKDNKDIGIIDDIIQDIVSNAEQRSSCTCEICGEYGQSRSGGWIKVLCDKHEEERKKERA